MSKIALGVLIAVLSSISIVSGSGPAISQPTSPTENKGVVSKALGAVELGPEIEGMAGRSLRIRMVTVAPGGVVASHSHRDRPCVEYILQGRVTEYRDGVAKEFGPGDLVTANKHTTHGWENKGDTPVILLPVDIFKQ